MEESSDLKGGHPPAVKVGNMRVAGHRSRTSSSGSGEKLTSEELRKQESEFGTEVSEMKQGQIVAGSIIKEENAYSPEAVKVYHEKPAPKHEKPHSTASHNIQQPRK